MDFVVYFTVMVLPVCNGYDYFLCCIMIASLGYKTCMQLRGVQFWSWIKFELPGL